MCSKKVEDSPNSVLRRYQVFFILIETLKNFNQVVNCMVLLTRRRETHTEFHASSAVAKNDYRRLFWLLLVVFRFLSSLELFRFGGGVVSRLPSITNANNRCSCLWCAISFSFDLGEFVFS